jgi:hypothetical protein
METQETTWTTEVPHRNAGARVQNTIETAKERVRHGVHDGRERVAHEVEQHPVRSLLYAFGIGAAVGLLAAARLRRR